MNKYCVLLLILINSTFAFGQEKHGQARVDSLLAELPKAKEDSNKAILLGSISLSLHSIDPLKSIDYGNKCIKLSKKINFLKGQSFGLYGIGVGYVEKGNYPKALEYLFTSLKICDQLNDKRRTGSIYQVLTQLYGRQFDYKKALEYGFKSLKLDSQLKDMSSIAINLGNIGLIYYYENKYDSSIFYGLKALELNQKLNEIGNIGLNLENIGIGYYGLKNFNLAIQYFLKSLDIYEKINSKGGMAMVLSNIGGTYKDLGKDSKSQMGKREKFNLAIKYLKRSITVSGQIGSLEGLRYSYNDLMEVENELGNYKEALEAYKNSIKIKDSIFNESSTKKIAGLETKRVEEVKGKEIQILKKQNQIAALESQQRRAVNYGMGSGLFAIVLVAGGFYRQSKKRHKLNIDLTESKQLSDTLLLNILPEETAAELKKDGKAIPRKYEEVSVLFSDIKGFTTISEKLSAEELVDLLDKYFGAFDEIIYRHGLEKIKTIGDAYMCAGGLQMKHEQFIENTILAAHKMQEFVAKVKRDSLFHHEHFFEIRIGIHIGPVVSGVVGTRKFAYDIWGDTVNTAARMEQNSEPGKVNVSEAVYNKMKDIFHFTSRGKLHAKNKGEIEMYFVEKKVEEMVEA